MYRLVLLVMACVIVLARPARAQESTPEPEQNYIVNWTTEIIFPQAVRFAIVLSRPAADLGVLRLTIQPNGQTPVAISLDLSAPVVGEPYSEFAYDWQIPANAPPRLFEDIRFEWQAATRGGERARVDDSVLFTDPRVTWLRRDAGPISLTIPTDGLDSPENVVGRLRRELQAVYDLLADNTGRSETFNLVVYANGAPGCEQNADGAPVAVGPVSGTVIPCDPALAGRIFEASGLEAIQSRSSGYSDMQAALVDTLVRRFYRFQNVPDWFAAGLSAFYAPAPRSDDLPRLMAAARSESLFSVNAMTRMPAGAERGVWEAQSYGMVLYVAGRVGLPGLFALARAADGTRPFDAAFQEAMNQPVTAMLADWRRWIFTGEAAAAFTITPYQPATPTPSPSRTLPPSATPVPTDTPTPLPPTWTSTPPGFAPTLTPMPSATPSRTPTPPPPSVTPRPAGSLNTPTPAPGLPLNLISSPAGILGLLSIILVSIAILVLLLMGFRRR